MKWPKPTQILKDVGRKGLQMVVLQMKPLQAAQILKDVGRQCLQIVVVQIKAL